ncbi:MAG: antA/AntB antirepressor family protein, partial [Fusobacteriaceae bacterium]
MKLSINENELGQVISARELYGFLQVKRDFTTWIKARIEKYKFVESEDYQVNSSFPQIGGKGGRPKDDYLLTLNTAKELSMIENNEKGRQARKYFIECEHNLKQIQLSIKEMETKDWG